MAGLRACPAAQGRDACATHTGRHLVATSRAALRARHFATVHSTALPLRLLAPIQMLNLSWRLGIAEEDVRALFEEARDLAKRTESKDALATAYLAYAVVRGMAGYVEESLKNVREATQLAEDAGNADLKLGLKMAFAYFGAAAGQLRESLAIAEEALSQNGREPTRSAELAGIDPFVFLTALRGHLLGQLGKLAGARAALDAALDLAANTPIRRFEDGSTGGSSSSPEPLAKQRTCSSMPTADSRSRNKPGVSSRRSLRLRILDAPAPSAGSGQTRSTLSRSRSTFPGEADRSEIEAGIVADLAEVILRSAITGGAGARPGSHRAGAPARREGGGMPGAPRHGAGPRPSRGREQVAAVRKALESAAEIARETEARVYEPFIHLELAEVARLAGDEAASSSELRTSSELFAQIGATGHLAAAGNADLRS